MIHKFKIPKPSIYQKRENVIIDILFSLCPFRIGQKSFQNLSKMDSDFLSVMADISNIEMPKAEVIDVKPDVPPDLTGNEKLEGEAKNDAQSPKLVTL